MSKFLLIILVFFVSACSSLGLKKKVQLDLDVQKYTLDNGLVVLLVKNTKLPIFSVQVHYRIGSKNEKKNMSGATHFLEHLMFKGAKKYGPGEFTKLVEGNGGKFNAYTTRDMTVYYENLPTSSLETMLDLEADRMQNLLLEPQAFEKERQVVLEERKMRYENSPYGQLYMEVFKKMFEGTPYEIPVIGSIKDINNVTRDQIFRYFKDYYAPNNAVLAIAGDINFDKTLALIKEKFGSLKKSPKEVVRNYGEYPLYGNRIENITLKGLSRNTLINYAYTAPGIKSRKARVLDLLASILGGGSSSFFHQKYVANDHPVMTQVYTSNYTLMHRGVFFIGGELLPKIDEAKFREMYQADLKQACHTAIDQESLDRIRKQILIGFYSKLEQNHSLASMVAEREVFYGDYQFYNQELEDYQTISVDDVRSACFDILESPKKVFSTLSN